MYAPIRVKHRKKRLIILQITTYSEQDIKKIRINSTLGFNARIGNEVINGIKNRFS